MNPVLHWLLATGSKGHIPEKRAEKTQRNHVETYSRIFPRVLPTLASVGETGKQGGCTLQE